MNSKLDWYLQALGIKRPTLIACYFFYDRYQHGQVFTLGVNSIRNIEIANKKYVKVPSLAEFQTRYGERLFPETARQIGKRLCRKGALQLYRDKPYYTSEMSRWCYLYFVTPEFGQFLTHFIAFLNNYIKAEKEVRKKW